MKVNSNTIQLKGTSPLIKNLFKPKSIVKAFVKKSSGENVIISVSNNTFRVKSMVNLEEGSWIKGRVFLDKNGTVNLKLLESFSPEEQLKFKAEEYVKKNSLHQYPGAKELVKGFFEHNFKPTKALIMKLAPLVENFTENQIITVTLLLSQNLSVNSQNLQGADMFMSPGLQFDDGNLIADILTLNLFDTGNGQNSLNFSHVKELFNIFINSENANNTLERFISILESNNNKGVELFNLTTLLQKLNTKNSMENLPFFGGIFFLNFSGGLRPVEFFLSRRFIKHDKKSKGKDYSAVYNLGLFINPPNLGPMVVRFFYTPPVLSLKFNVNNTNSLDLLESNVSLLKNNERFKKIQIAKVEFEKSDIDTVNKARKTLKAPYNPFGALDVKA